MSRNRKKLEPVRIAGEITIKDDQKISINVKNFFGEGANRKYLHYFMPYTKKIFLLNLDKKVEDKTKNEVF